MWSFGKQGSLEPISEETSTYHLKEFKRIYEKTAQISYYFILNYKRIKSWPNGWEKYSKTSLSRNSSRSSSWHLSWNYSRDFNRNFPRDSSPWNAGISQIIPSEVSPNLIRIPNGEFYWYCFRNFSRSSSRNASWGSSMYSYRDSYKDIFRDSSNALFRSFSRDSSANFISSCL